ncbi:hypothetical protein DMB65_14495 [Flavobacterium cheongpyeongense]|uniref:DUF4836 domain-containing protein n=1 Tax=Flavobacterium cheongpyeongense TaxID=2212651 RepID=A0A2V4BM17_9FLAO|nr:hypothetical protein [Flavobacterium cheongpyeongense]PXY39998.1 hypothetical protein DMB65_14495 [Flavobacterium cheongpyeongense]
MKQFFTLFILFTFCFAYSQTLSKKQDYFVQFNGGQLSKKVSVAEVLNHSLLKNGKMKLNANQYADLIKLDQKITVHGNYSDSIPYYQVTIPIKSRNDIKTFLIQKDKESDSIEKPLIEDFGQYSVYNSGDKKTTIAWNDNHLVIFGLTKRYSYNDYAVTTAVDSVAVVSDSSAVIMEQPYEPAVDTAYTAYSDDYYANYQKEQTAFDSIQSISQNRFIKMLFENGFTVPASDKVHENADISCWFDYGSAMSSFNTAYAALARFTTYNKFLQNQKNIGNFVKGINVDFYFDNDNARVEEIVEYSKSMADIAGKICNRKVNKNIFNYFPAQKPLGYMTYHFNTKEILNNFPAFSAEIFTNPYILKEDISVATDLISTIIDEEATATLFDGDLSMFLYDVVEREVTTKTYEYDENYESKEVEKTIKKTVPLFSVIFTSTHPTFADKLIQLGVRKNGLTPKGNYYEIKGTQEYGNLFIFKDKDVVIIGNSIDHIFPKENSFSKEVKKELKQNYFASQVSMDKLVTAYSNSSEAKPSDMKSLNLLAQQFTDVTLYSGKKLVDNKLKFELKLNSSKGDKNIILQTLDMIEELSTK